MDNFINKFKSEEDFSIKKPSLEEKEHYLAYTEDNDKIYRKKNDESQVIFYVKNIFPERKTKIFKYNDNSSQPESTQIILEEGVNIINNLDYGFGFSETFLLYGNNKIYGINLSSYDTSNVTDMSSMFNRCSELTSLDLSNFDTSNVRRMDGMFRYCTNLTSLDVSSFDTSKVTLFGYPEDYIRRLGMFCACSGLTSLDLSSFDTSNAISMDFMFFGCANLTYLDLSNFDTSNVTSMGEMFAVCSGLTSLDLSKFDTSKVTDMSSMFNGCNSLTNIKCKQVFKDWCWENQDTMKLPSAMREGGSGTWEIVE